MQIYPYMLTSKVAICNHQANWPVLLGLVSVLVIYSYVVVVMMLSHDLLPDRNPPSIHSQCDSRFHSRSSFGLGPSIPHVFTCHISILCHVCMESNMRVQYYSMPFAILLHQVYTIQYRSRNKHNLCPLGTLVVTQNVHYRD